MKRTTLPSGSIWRLTTKCNIKTIKLSPQFWDFSPSFLTSLLVYLPVAVKKRQLVTPYGREWRGRFEHLPAWTPPYAVEFDCLLSLINEKSDVLFLPFQFLTCFHPVGWLRHIFLPTPLGFYRLPACHAEEFGSTCLSLLCVGCI